MKVFLDTNVFLSVIITINKKHFKCKDIKVMTPQEFLDSMK